MERSVDPAAVKARRLRGLIRLGISADSRQKRLVPWWAPARTCHTMGVNFALRGTATMR